MPNPLCHFEFMSADVARWKSFYGQVFDWSFDDKTMPGYTVIHPGGEPNGGVFPKPPDAPGPCLTVYFAVKDIDETLGKVTERGGKLLVPRTPIPNVGEFALFTDPEGIIVGLLQPNR